MNQRREGGEEPLVTVLTPVYNGERYLAECIESVLGQGYENYEYIIVNNCSTDDTRKIAERYARRDSRIRIHDNRTFRSAVGNHNRAFELISPESRYTKIVQADDQIYPECIGQQVAVAERHPRVGVVGAYMIQGTQVVCDRVPFTAAPSEGQYPVSVMTGRETCRNLLFAGPGTNLFGASPTATLMRSELIRKHAPLYKESHIYADIIAYYDVLQECDYGFVHQVLSFARVHPGQETVFSARMNAFLTCRLYLLKHYGRLCLDREEYALLLSEKMTEYYRFLAKNLFYRRNLRKERVFWEFHREEFRRIGLPFRKARLAGAALWEVLDILLNPKKAMELLYGSLARRVRSGK